MDEMETLRQVWLELDKIFNKKNPGSQKTINADTLTCSDCKETIPQVVADYSRRYYGNFLCRDCQLKHKKKTEGTEEE
jgi:hypothetical protein